MRTKLETALAALVFILPSTTAYAATPQEMVGIVRSKAEAAVEERLRDPQSVNFYNVTAYRMRAGSNVPTAVCGEFNAKNGFGGYHGREPFVWIAIMEPLFSAQRSTRERCSCCANFQSLNDRPTEFSAGQILKPHSLGSIENLRRKCVLPQVDLLVVSFRNAHPVLDIARSPILAPHWLHSIDQPPQRQQKRLIERHYVCQTLARAWHLLQELLLASRSNFEAAFF